MPCLVATLGVSARHSHQCPFCDISNRNVLDLAVKDAWESRHTNLLNMVQMPVHGQHHHFVLDFRAFSNDHEMLRIPSGKTFLTGFRRGSYCPPSQSLGPDW